MNQSHTPGPWAYDEHSRTDALRARVVVANGLPVAWVERAGSPPFERDANARLIAAAPELLAALEQVTDSAAYWFKRNGDPDGATSEMMARARAAIAKAKGVEA